MAFTNSGLAHWNGTAWSTLPGSSGAASASHMLARAPNDVYLFRSTEIAHYDGVSVRVIQTGTSSVNAVAWKGSEAIAVGNNGYMLRATLPPPRAAIR